MTAETENYLQVYLNNKNILRLIVNLPDWSKIKSTVLADDHWADDHYSSPI